MYMSGRYKLQVTACISMVRVTSPLLPKVGINKLFQGRQRLIGIFAFGIDGDLCPLVGAEGENREDALGVG